MSDGYGASAGTEFGQYRLLERLGHGGMGEVWRARDTRRERTVALKLLSRQWADNAEFRERFRREATAAAGLVSAHVVVIHDFGEIDGRMFIDMRLVPGGDLGDALRAAPNGLGVARAVNLVAQIASGLDVAHRAGVLHRDVKPSNVLLEPDRAGEQAYLVDFGIAKVADETSAGLTATGESLGTPAYMAPELFTGDGQASVASDVYALGCVLFEMLTGRRPFTAGSSAGLMHQHLNAPLPLPSTVAPGLAAFDPVLARALAKDPRVRQRGAGALADDVAAAGAAAVTGAGGRTGRTPPPYPQPVAYGVAAYGPAAPAPAVVRRDDGAPRRRRTTIVAVVAAAVLVAAAATATVVVTSRTGGGDTPPSTEQVAAPAVVPPPTAPERVAVALTNPVGVALTADGRRAFVADADTDTVTVLDTATRGVLARVPAGKGPTQLALTPGDRDLYVVGSGPNDNPAQTVTVLDATTYQVTATVAVGPGPLGVVASPDGRRVYVALAGVPSKPGTSVVIIDTATRAVTGSVPVGTGPARLSISPDGRELYTADFGAGVGNTLTVVDTATLATRTLPSGDAAPNIAIPAPDARRLYVVNLGAIGTTGSVTVVDLDTRTARPFVPSGITDPRAGALSPDGRTLVVTNYGVDETAPGRTVAIIDATTGALRRTLTLPSQPNEIAIAPSGNQAWISVSNPGGLYRIPLA